MNDLVIAIIKYSIFVAIVHNIYNKKQKKQKNKKNKKCKMHRRKPSP